MEPLSKIKQPAPSVAGIDETMGADGKKYKIIQNQNIGVIQLPKISKTPIRDTIELKREEKPYIKYKLSQKQYKLKGFQTSASLVVTLCGIVSIFKLLKK